MHKSNKARQPTIIENFVRMQKKKPTEQRVRPQTLNKEEIYESAEQDDSFDIPSVPHKYEKKQSKLMTFLSKMDKKFEQELGAYLSKNKDGYQPQKNVCLYEDILFIFGFKKAEEDLKKNKKQESEKLLKELEGLTNKKSITIKERVEKKLANLSIQQLRQFMESGEDISFNQQKSLNIKGKSKTTTQAIGSSDDIDINTPNKNEGTQTKKTIPFKEETKYLDNHFKNNHAQGTKKSLFSNQVIYKYGKPVKEPIKFVFDRKDKVLFTFKKSIFESYMEQQQGSNSVEVCQQNPQEDKKEVIYEEVDQVSELKNSPATKIENKAIKAIESYFRTQTMERSPESFKNQIQKVKQATIISLANLKEVEQTEQIKSKIKDFENKLEEIDKLQQKISQQKKKTIQKKLSPRDTQSEEQNKTKLLPSTSKKSFPDETQSNSEAPQKTLEISPQDAKNQLERLMYRLNNNEKYFEIIKNDPNKLPIYAWDDEEDKILWAFNFNPAATSQQIRCLLRYKSMAMIKERINFIGVDMNEKGLTQLNSIEEGVNPLV